jgi:hypothetical protein
VPVKQLRKIAIFPLAEGEKPASISLQRGVFVNDLQCSMRHQKMRLLLRVLPAIAVACALAGSSSVTRADAVTFSYDFTGSVIVNPGPFSGSASSPGFTAPTFTASSYAPGASSSVVQSGLGLGVYSDPFGPSGGETGIEPYVIDAVGRSSNGNPEVLRLTFNNSDPSLVNTKVTNIELGRFSDLGSSSDFQVYLDSDLIGSFDFPSSGNVLVDISILSGQVLSFVGIPPIGENDNDFTVSGLTVTGEAAVPEPASLAVWGFSLVAFGAYVRRRRQAAA